MSYEVRTRDQHWANDGGPKRILSLDGGGVRGILTLGVLEVIERLLAEQHGVDYANGKSKFRLCHYFDLIAGTSTGAIIAAGLAKGMSVGEIKKEYFELGEKVFKKSFFRKGFFRAKYGSDDLEAELTRVFGARTKIGDAKHVKTGLLVMTKRVDTSSPWPITNNPKGKYFGPRPSGSVPNGQYLLRNVVRASTAAPSFFEPEKLAVARKGRDIVEGDFVDGGVSPANNPSLQALMYATLEGHNVQWPMGQNKVLLVSVGTGRSPSGKPASSLAVKGAVQSLLSLMDDSADLVETMMQWMSRSGTARSIDSEMGDLSNDLLGGRASMTYQRYNAELEKGWLGAELGFEAQNEKEAKQVESLREMDDPKNMQLLYDIGAALGEKRVKAAHFPKAFKLS